MKRIKNLVIGGIENKIFNLILFTVILLTAAYMAVSVYHANMLTELTYDSSELQEAALGEISDMVMNSVIDKSLSRSTALEAYISNNMFHDLESRVQMLGEYAAKLFSDPQAYPRFGVALPDPARDGEVTTQLITAEGLDGFDADLSNRIGLVANMSDLMVALFNASAETNSCFVALPDGVFIITDDRSGAKYDGDGNRISYDPRTRFWYDQAVEAGKLIITDVELDAFTGDVGVVCAMPVYVGDELAAVVGSDLFLNSMQDAVMASEENGTYVAVVNQHGHVIFSPRTEGEFQVRTSSDAEDLRLSENEALADFITEAMKAPTELRLLELSDGPSYVIGVPMETVGWTVISVCSKAAAQEPAAMLKSSYANIQTQTISTYRQKTDISRRMTIFLLIGVTLLTLAGALTLGKRIVMPLNNITKKIAQISSRDLEFKMDASFRTGDEIEELAECFARISHKTVEYLETVKQVTAEKERIGTELALATDIQAAMLPHIFPAFPDRPEFDLYASMNPAKEVGGDFYDYFLVDNDHLCLVIADVSGKGVPAALFMMASKIIIQSYAMQGFSTGEILERTNTALCSNNEAEMFVTVWLGILELSTGKIKASNAGHEYPAVKFPDGQYELFKDKHSFVIGGMEGLRYKEYELVITPGTRLFVYTDGVPEATNAEEELFGTKRLLDALNSRPDESPQETLSTVRQAVDDFVQNAEQFDDLTMLCVEFKGTETK